LPVKATTKKQQAHAGYHLKLYLGGGEPTYRVGPTWNGFIISKEMASQLPKASPPSRSAVKMTCQLQQGGPDGRGTRWHLYVLQLDFLDEKGAVVKTVK
jgi:hypothetical protein